jgi:hypothetical protein
MTVDVDTCRVRLQTGKATFFVDVRRQADWAASALQVAGAIKLSPDTAPVRLPCHKHNYIVVYCA